ncbi:MAG: peptidylprolyl isomerase, partial [Pseudomonadota bacterium]
MKLIFTFLITLMLFMPQGFAAKTFEIAATVNDDAISQADIDDRMALFMASTGTRPTKENIKAARAQVLEVLIEEQLKIQEAKRLNQEITEEEIEEGFNNLAKQNGLEAEDFSKALAQQGIPKETMLRQLKAQLAWTKVVTSYLRPQINVSETDIDTKMGQMKSKIGREEYLTSEIFLPVKSEEEDVEMKKLAEKLIEEIKLRGAPFSLVATQFSKSSSAANGGQMGWISEGELPKELDLVLRNLEVKTISEPIRGLSGYHIMAVREKRMKTEETMPGEEDVLNAIGLERLDRMQQRHLSD